MVIEYPDLGRLIRLLRKQTGITQGDLAKRCGISASFMNHIERGTRTPSLETLIKLSDELNEPVDVLLGRDEERRGDSLMRHNDEVKREALESIKEIGVPKTKEKTGISLGTLYKWRKEVQDLSEKNIHVETARALLAEDDSLLEKISALEMENMKLRALNEKLKKVLLTFIE